MRLSCCIACVQRETALDHADSRSGTAGAIYNRAFPPGRWLRSSPIARGATLQDMTKFVFVTGGVVSSLGKGIASASLAAILESRGLKVTLIKLDPYLNVDPGTMSPFQHGEVFVTDDGAETDLDLGHYERFITTRMKRSNNFTTGQIYKTRARKRATRRLPRQDSAGHPARHQRDPSASCATAPRPTAVDVAIVEIGGTVGDIESLPFLEAVRQMSLKLGPANTAYRAPHLRALDCCRGRTEDQAHTAHRARSCARSASSPTCCCAAPTAQYPKKSARKISLFTNVQPQGVISHVGRRHHLQGAAHAARAEAWTRWSA